MRGCGESKYGRVHRQISITILGMRKDRLLLLFAMMQQFKPEKNYKFPKRKVGARGCVCVRDEEFCVHFRDEVCVMCEWLEDSTSVS
jgi:hypothetical protein